MTPATLEPFRYYMRVRYAECDGQRVVYNAAYGTYIDLAATEFLRAVFAPQPAFDGSFELQVVKLLVEWQGPARFDDVLEIAVRATKLGNTALTLGFEIRKAGTATLIATGETVNVHVDKISWGKQPIPDAIRARLQAGAAGQRIDHAGYLK
jgi:acyl-CoA thioester hydrolase